jgi:hypothetical protein
MSWSNILDYIDFETFNYPTRRCSITGDTAHFRISMNWVRMVPRLVVVDHGGKCLPGVAAERGDRTELQMNGTGHAYLSPAQSKIPCTQQYLLSKRITARSLSRLLLRCRSKETSALPNCVCVFHALGASSPADTGCSATSFTCTSEPGIHFNPAYRDKVNIACVSSI